MRLVDDAVPPVELLQRVLLFDDHLVRRDAHVELPWLKVFRDLLIPHLGVAVELKRADHGTPPFELVHPVA